MYNFLENNLKKESYTTKYLMLDHGGVLDGIITEEKPGDNDLLLEQIDEGLYQVLKNGVTLVKQLSVLIKEKGYEIAFHSKNKEKDQLHLLEQLKKACSEKDIEWPRVTAMAVRDQDIFQEVNSKEAILIKDRNHGILVAGYSQELDGKSCVRSALSCLLGIDEKSRFQHIVFDDGPSVVISAKSEGYQAYLINQDFPLDKAINEVFKNIGGTYKNEAKEFQLKNINELEKQPGNNENCSHTNLFFQFESLKQQGVGNTKFNELGLNVESLKDANQVALKKID